VNEAQGLHHWFQVNQRLAGSSNLSLKLQVSGADAVRKSGENAVEVSVKGLRFQYSGLKVWDAKGRELEARMEALPEQSQIALVVNDAQASYPLTIDPTWTQEAKLVASDKARDDNFGYSVSLSADRALVGAPQSDPGGTANAGAAYIFTRATDGTWSQEAKLVASDKARDDNFGWTVSLSGDRALVGAYLSDPGSTNNAGAAYIFTRATDGTWTQEAKLTASDKAMNAQFGLSVSLNGDRALVGANLSSPGGTTYAGAAYIFTRASNGAWTQEAKLVASDKASNDWFGQSVSLSGDRALVGSVGSDPGGSTSAGAAYVFTRASNGAWTQEAKLVASDKAANDYFGFSVSLSGDRALVGAFYSDPGGTTDAGAAYVFTRASNGTWTQEAKLVASDKAAGDNFGYSVSLSADRAIVGALYARQAAGGAARPGTAYVFSRTSGGTWSQDSKLVASDPLSGDRFGNSVAISGNRVLIGAYFSDPGGTLNAGAAYVFNFTTPTIAVSFPTLDLYGGIPGFYGGTTRTSAGTITISEAAPAGGVTVSLSAPGTTIAASVTIPAGATTATFDVSANQVVSETVVTVTATATGYTTGSANLKVRPKAVLGVSFPTLDLYGGIPGFYGGTTRTSAGTITISEAAPAGGVTVSLSAPGTTIASSVTIPAGATTATFDVSANQVVSETVVTVTATATGCTNGSANLKVRPKAVLGVSFPTLYRYGGVPGFYGGLTRANAGTVTVSEAAPTGGLTVNLSAPGTTIPSSVTIPAGATTATFDVSADRVASDTVATVTASATGCTNGSANLKVLANAVLGLYFPQKEVNSSSSITGTLKLVVPALTDFTATLTSSNPSAFSVPTSVVVPAGASQVSVTATSGLVSSDTAVTVSSRVQVSAITVKTSRELVSVAVSPIHYGRTGTGRVELAAPALAGGQVVTLKSNQGNVTVPATVLVPGGETGANFTVTSTGTDATSATITATVGKTSKTATVTVVQPTLASVTLTPASVVGGNSSTMRATLTAPAPQGGVVVSLTASNGFATGLPATVTIPEGQTFADVTVNTAAHTSTTARTVTLKALVSANRSTRSAVLTITRN
jgi:hypothetical protein